LQEAERNHGQVYCGFDTADKKHVAIKRMPNSWIRNSHAEFETEHPNETELPWQDVGCNRYLNEVGFPYSCELLGVHRDSEYTHVITSLATEGDLFTWSTEVPMPPGLDRERVVKPIARQVLRGAQMLHQHSIVHRDMSMENVLVTKGYDSDLPTVRLIDFSMASNLRYFRKSSRGKPSYQAPEVHGREESDAFLTDAFAVGVCIYIALLQDYPWMSTRPTGCKCFQYASKFGFRKFLAKRKLRSTGRPAIQSMSEPLVQLLEGLLAIDPRQRLTLGEASWKDCDEKRRSVWDEPWVSEAPSFQY
jgi:serine/threonine protein kinase